MAFSPDKRILVTGSRNGTTILWDLAGLDSRPDDVTERACAITGGGLDPDEWARRITGLPYENTCPS